ncbi:MAG: phosphatase PAP2 family protein [Actinomycetota bacterium]|nr:phosphatase PAP2 family protein [Actinomycetota bacterium]
MPLSRRARAVIQRWRNSAQRLHQRLGLSTRGMAALVGALGVLGTALLFFAGLSEDVTQHNGLASEDRSHLRFFIHHRTTQLVQDARWVTQLGSVGVLAVLALVVAAVLWFRGTRLLMAVAPGLALGVAGVCVAIAKQLVGRARPPVSLHRVTEAGASFPSGHATDSTAFYLTLGLVMAVVVLRRPVARIATVAGAAMLSAAIGTSRLLLGVHWPTDVLAGWALGATAALAVTLLVTLIARFVHVDGPTPEGRMARFSHRFAHLALLSRPPKASLASRR